MCFGDLHLIDGETEAQSQTESRAVKPGCQAGGAPPWLAWLLGTHQHLPARHEVGALADPLKDALQLGADEVVILGEKGTKKQQSSEGGGGGGTPEGVSEVRACWWVGWGRSKVRGQGSCYTLDAEHLANLEGGPPNCTQGLHNPLGIGL